MNTIIWHINLFRTFVSVSANFATLIARVQPVSVDLNQMSLNCYPRTNILNFFCYETIKMKTNNWLMMILTIMVTVSLRHAPPSHTNTQLINFSQINRRIIMGYLLLQHVKEILPRHDCSNTNFCIWSSKAV